MAKENTDDATRYVMNRANISATCDHANIIHLYGICSGPPTLMIIEYMSLGNLLQFLRNLEEQSNLITEQLEDLTYIAVQVLNITLTLSLHSFNSPLSTFVLQLPVQSVPITTKVVSSMARCTRYNIM
jgi:serine/threonine protein kinase